MLKKLLIFILFNIIFSGFIFSQGLIVDHTSTDISAIPSNIIDSIKLNKKFQWCGQSHSHQITAGLELLENENPLLDVTIEPVTLPEPNGTFSIMEGITLHFAQCGTCCWEYIYPTAYWQGQDAWDGVEKTFNECYPEINLSGFSWCGELSDHDTSYVRAYLDTLANYESTYPEIQFIYVTGHAQANDVAGYNRWKNNEFIRNYCIDNNKILFDFGDLDCWSNGEFSYYLYEGDTIPIQHSDYNEDIIYHTNALSCKNKARAVWYMMARLSGWDREIKVSAKVYLEGSFNGLDMNNSLNSSGSLPLFQPYNIAPWNYNGYESVSVIPNADVVDWVLVELRDAAQPVDATEETIVGKMAGFLLNDGLIVNLDGYSPLDFNVTINDNLYIVVRHISHLDIIGANPANLIEDTYEYDFTSSEYQVYGGMSGHKEIAVGIWGMISGDGNGDGTINMNDKYDTWLNQSGQSGYKTADFDMGGKVDNRDKNEKWLDNINKESQIPN